MIKGRMMVKEKKQGGDYVNLLVDGEYYDMVRKEHADQIAHCWNKMQGLPAKVKELAIQVHDPLRHYTISMMAADLLAYATPEPETTVGELEAGDEFRKSNAGTNPIIYRIPDASTDTLERLEKAARDDERIVQIICDNYMVSLCKSTPCKIVKKGEK